MTEQERKHHLPLSGAKTERWRAVRCPCGRKGCSFGSLVLVGRRLPMLQDIDFLVAMVIAKKLNAYPRLVKALRLLQQRIDDCQLGPVNSGREEADAIAAEAEAARDLLREQIIQLSE